MKAVRIALAGRERYLAFTVEAMFQLEERFGGVQELIEAVSANSWKGFQAACLAASILAEQGELARRHMGYDSAPIPFAEEIEATTAPSGIAALKMAVTSAISLGFGREIEPDSDEVDIGLAELNEQKKQCEAGAFSPDGDGLRLLPEGDAAGLPRGGQRRVGAVSAGPRGEEKAGG